MTDYKDHYLKAIWLDDPIFRATFEAETDFLLKRILDRDAQKVLDVGCGNGRTLGELAPRITSGKEDYTMAVHLYGIDANPELIRLADQRSIMLDWAGGFEMYFEQDARNMGFKNDEFDFAFSSYNTLGEIGAFEPNARQEVINEMARVVKPGGLITNITWKQDRFTTDFLQRYYPAIGFDIVDLRQGMSVVKDPESGDVYRFARIHPRGLEGSYERAGLIDFETEEVGPLWVAVSGLVSGGEE